MVLEMDILEAIKQQLAANPVLLFMKGTPDFPQCGFSSQVAGIMKECGQEFAFINILEHPDVRETLKEYANWPTYPQLWIKGELVGGCDIVVQMFEQGQLKPMLEEATQEAA